MSTVAPRRPLSEQPVLNLGQAHNPNALRFGDVGAKEGSGKGGGKSHGDLDQEHGDWRDLQPITIRCDCGDFTADGLAGEARARFQAHLAAAHPERVGKGPRRNRRAFEKAEQVQAAMPAVVERAVAAVALEQRKENEMEEETEPPFACDQCDRRFVTAQALAIHRGRSHKPAEKKRERKITTEIIPRPASASNGHKPTSPVELAREIVLLSQDITNTEAELIGKYARLGELGRELSQIGAERA